MDREVRWAPWRGPGLEHLRLRRTPAGYLAESVVIGARNGRGFGLSYRILCDDAWRLREARLALVGQGQVLDLCADGQGRWWRRDGTRLPELDGCIDIDLSATPFTNTLPIRRLGLAEGESRALRVAYVPVPGFEIVAVDQRYTCLEAGRRYRYEGLFRGFVGELPVDADGLVIDYPETFRRVPEDDAEVRP